MSINILVFGPLTDITEANALSFKTPDNTDVLKQALIEQYPKLKTQHYNMAVNKKIIQEPINLKDGDEVALLPPFSGG